MVPERLAVRLTLEEVGEVVERSVLRVSVPFLQSQAVERLQAERLPLTVHHDDLTAVAVQTRHILKDTHTHTHVYSPAADKITNSMTDEVNASSITPARLKLTLVIFHASSNKRLHYLNDP